MQRLTYVKEGYGDWWNTVYYGKPFSHQIIDRFCYLPGNPVKDGYSHTHIQDRLLYPRNPETHREKSGESS